MSWLRCRGDDRRPCLLSAIVPRSSGMASWPRTSALAVWRYDVRQRVTAADERHAPNGVAHLARRARRSAIPRSGGVEMMHVCSERNCPVLVERGRSRCVEHARQPWAQSDARDATDSRAASSPHAAPSLRFLCGTSLEILEEGARHSTCEASGFSGSGVMWKNIRGWSLCKPKRCPQLGQL